MTTYRLKQIRYQNNSNCHILLQNENGPCPLLAAANGLLLRGTLEFPAHCLQHGVASLEDVTNMLANQALATEDKGSSSSSSSDTKFHIDELLKWIPQFQNGMDVNPGFCRPNQYEYSAQLTAWDMFRIQLLHGWLVEPQSAEAEVIKNYTYNILVEKIIQAREAAAELEQLERETASPPLIDSSTTDSNQQLDRQAKIERLQQLATQGSLMEHFLESTSHQLTAHGLQKLRDHLSNDQLAVFFRNNHFGLMTKHNDQLYLLVTDLGYADSPDIVWERLDAIDGNTTLVNADFCENRRQQEEEAYQMALQLSLQQQDQDAYQQQQGTTVILPPLEGTCAEASCSKPATISASQPFAAVGVPVSMNSVVLPAPPSGGMPSSYKGTGVVSGDASEALSAAASTSPVIADADVMLARQLQDDWNNNSSSNEIASLQLARQLQGGEDTESLQLARRLQAEENARSRQQRSAAPRQSNAPSKSKDGCVVS